MHAYTRIAVDVVLRAELTSALKQHLFVGAPHTDWGFPLPMANKHKKPEVQMFKLGHAAPVVRRDLKGSFVLYDVHLRLLKSVAKSWSLRAQAQQQADARPAPLICFPPMVGALATGDVVLCAIENGPALTVLERALVKAAFWYRPSRREGLSLTTKRMLDEIGAEVENAAEQRHFGAAEDGLRKLIRLHKTLLLASAADSKGETENAATIGTSPYAWGESSLDVEWLKPYREVGRIAVDHLDEDQRLLRLLAVVPQHIAAELPARPEKLVIDAMLVGMNLYYQLAGWWTRKADASLAPGATAFSGTLPAPLNKAYEQALIALVGGWSQFHVQAPESTTTSPAEIWTVLAARALVYVKHIENSAAMFLKAVSRGDDEASGWLLDNFLKWWGNRQHELGYGPLDELQVPRHVTLTLARLSWDDAQRFLSDWQKHVTVEAAGRALNLAIRRYWESMRLYLILLLIDNGGANPPIDSRELRCAGALISGTAQKRGGSVVCWPLDSVDAVSTAILGTAFGVEAVVGLIDKFAEQLRWEREAPEVPGWIYGWSGSPGNIASMKRAQATLLTVVATAHSSRVGDNKKLVESWCNDPEKLELVARHCHDLRWQVLVGDCASADTAAAALRAHLGAPMRARSSRLTVARTMKELGNVARTERINALRVLKVDEDMVSRLRAEIAAFAFESRRLPAEFGITIAFVHCLEVDTQSIQFEDDKKRFISGGIRGQFDAGLAEHTAAYVRAHALAYSFGRRVIDGGLSAVNSPAFRGNFQANVEEMQAFITAVGSSCTALREAGTEPIILFGRAAPGSYLQPHRWGNADWQCPLPPGVTIRYGDPSKGDQAKVFVNDVPVSDFETPNGDCFVVPAAMFRTLEVAGADAVSSLSIAWTQVSDERLKFVVSWKARFR